MEEGQEVMNNQNSNVHKMRKLKRKNASIHTA